jgi:hypothetical protein
LGFSGVSGSDPGPPGGPWCRAGGDAGGRGGTGGDPGGMGGREGGEGGQEGVRGVSGGLRGAGGTTLTVGGCRVCTRDTRDVTTGVQTTAKLVFWGGSKKGQKYPKFQKTGGALFFSDDDFSKSCLRYPPRLKKTKNRILSEHHLVEYHPVPKNRGRSGWRYLLPQRTGLKGYPSKGTFFAFLAFI